MAKLIDLSGQRFGRLVVKRRVPGYANRPITPRWASFENFLADMGECPEGYSLERVNNDLGYFPDNCKWIPKGDQAKNTSRSRLITHAGRTQILTDWAREVGIDSRTLTKRLARGWSIQRALEQRLRRPPS